MSQLPRPCLCQGGRMYTSVRYAKVVESVMSRAKPMSGEGEEDGEDEDSVAGTTAAVGVGV